MSGPKPDTAPGMGVMGLLRVVVENARGLATELREEATELRRRADENDRRALALDELHAIAEPHVPADRQAALELTRSA